MSHNAHWEIKLPSIFDHCRLSVVCTPTTLGSMDSSPSDLSVKVYFMSMRLLVLELQ